MCDKNRKEEKSSLGERERISDYCEKSLIAFRAKKTGGENLRPQERGHVEAGGELSKGFDCPIKKGKRGIKDPSSKGVGDKNQGLKIQKGRGKRTPPGASERKKIMGEKKKNIEKAPFGREEGRRSKRENKGESPTGGGEEVRDILSQRGDKGGKIVTEIRGGHHRRGIPLLKRKELSVRGGKKSVKEKAFYLEGEKKRRAYIPL